MLKVFFQDILDASEKWDSDSILKAQGLLTFFSKVTDPVSFNCILKNILIQLWAFQYIANKSLDINYCTKKIKNFLKISKK